MHDVYIDHRYLAMLKSPKVLPCYEHCLREQVMPFQLAILYRPRKDSTQSDAMFHRFDLVEGGQASQTPPAVLLEPISSAIRHFLQYHLVFYAL
ncbi:hypothetical protein K437DRAFT_284820 [Tilletiaria anomala UBC 951]|uniref:Uncharacterized protein n=1 Tax=Tilletiaria anomala (strain ATCC 24038 / CBS 436.72 / UBC 951) TaxID=1037660 RepID=A0A066W7E2_TILAU|nr:uncharacterized protein K437DRAFT_284820 [Tilletiaria anomala UBC 951]KDN47009.1 hypothetical protein K437DRAFT_284820 [Tilletiaria anomala UBC 951]